MGGERVISFDETSIDDLIALTGHTSASSKPTLATDDTFSSHKRTATVSFDEVPLDDLISIAQCQDTVPEIGIAYWLGKQWLFGESNYDLCLRKVRTSGTRTTYRLPEGCSSAAASDAAGKMWSALATDDDGACALHAALGAPAERPSVLRCSRARVLASRLVGPTLQDVRVRAQDERLVTCVASALWSEFVLPSMRQDEEIAEDFESTLFMEHLRLLCPSVTSEVDELQNVQSAARDAESSLRRQLMQATRDLFLCSESGELIHSMSSRMGHIPAFWPHSMLLEADGNDDSPYELMQLPFVERSTGARIVRASQVSFPSDGPQQRYAALFDDRTCFDGLRLAFVRAGGKDAFRQQLQVAMGVIDSPAMIAMCPIAERIIALTLELDASVPWDSVPVDFAERAWPAYLAAIQEKNYFFSVDELLLQGHLADVNVVIARDTGSEYIFFAESAPKSARSVHVKIRDNATGRARTHFRTYCARRLV